KMPWRCGMMLRLQFNNRVALSSCNRRAFFTCLSLNFIEAGSQIGEGFQYVPVKPAAAPQKP
ncbi:hypothetical protein, partial [Pseudomonas aeruginosa]|uniref:hypothetical protein n=1 Tax=Pseudomonas aeruginosa TaxID=287 RepID=UPI001C2CFF7D